MDIPEKKNNLYKYLSTLVLIILTWVSIRLIQHINRSDINITILDSIPIIFTITLSLFFAIDTKKIKTIICCILPVIITYSLFIIFAGSLRFKMPEADAISLDIYNPNLSQALRNTRYFLYIIFWFFVLLSYSKLKIKKLEYNAFLEKCGETIVWSAILIAGGVVMIFLLVSLFNSIKINASGFIYENIMTLWFAASPFLSLLIIDRFKKIKLSVIIANVFLPVILISLLAFGIASMFSGSKPYEDRDIFVVYNIMMVLVICILVFTGIHGINNKIINVCFFILPVITVVLNGITLSAVIYRLNAYGISANKLTLLGTNIIMFGHLIFMIYLKLKSKIERNVLYLPVYFFWACFVVFIFPIIFRVL